MSRKEARRRVQRGARWLDLIAPGWEASIDLSTLAMVSPMDCILGQVFAYRGSGMGSGYGWARRYLLGGTENIYGSSDRESLVLAQRLGFHPGGLLGESTETASVDDLETVWRDVIEKRVS